MAAVRREVDEHDMKQWAGLRQQAAEAIQALVANGPGVESPLDQLAWKAGTLPDSQFSFDNQLRLLIEDARDHRYTWREIAAALGEGDDEISSRRVKDKQAWRNKAYEEQKAKQE